MKCCSSLIPMTVAKLFQNYSQKRLECWAQKFYRFDDCEISYRKLYFARLQRVAKEYYVLKDISGPHLKIKTDIRILMLNIRRSLDRLIFNIGFPILLRHLYIETAPRFISYVTAEKYLIWYTNYHCKLQLTLIPEHDCRVPVICKTK